MGRAWQRGSDVEQENTNEPPRGNPGGPHRDREDGPVSSPTSTPKAPYRANKQQREVRSSGDMVLELTSRQLEGSVISSLLFDPTLMADIIEEVEPDDFVVEPFCSAYRVAVDLWSSRTPFDLAICSSRIGQSEAAEMMEELIKLDEHVKPGYGIYYAREVARLGQRRDAIRSMTEAISEVYQNPEVEVPSVISKAGEKSIRNVRDIRARTSRQIADDSIQQLRDERSGVIPKRQVTSGYREFDQILGGGFNPGDLIVLAARPSLGKTAISMDMLINSTDVQNGQSRTGIMFSAEMSSDSLMRRLGSRLSGISLGSIRSGRMDDDDFSRVEDAIDSVGEINLVIDDTRKITTDQMKLTIQRTQADMPVGFVVFDYMEMAGDNIENENMNETSRISKVVQSLKDVGMECGVPIMALSQVGRQVDQRKNKVPGMSDLRMSAMIEQTADVVVFLYSHDYYVKRGVEQFDSKRSNLMELHIAKNRNGAVGRVDLGYDAERMTFLDLSDATKNEEWYS